MAKRRRRRRGGGDPFIRQARLESRVQYGPEEDALRALLKEARYQLKTGISAEKGAAQGIINAINQATPEMRRAYQGAGLSQAAADAQLRQDLQGLGAAADPYRASAATEAAGATQRLSAGMFGAMKELSERKIGAQQGRAYAVRAHVQEYRQDAGKVRDRQRSLAREKGAFIATSAEKLRGAAADQALAERRVAATERQADTSAAAEQRQARKTEADITGIDPKTGKPVKGPKGKGSFSAGALSAHRKIVSGVQDASATAQRLKRLGLSWAEIGAVLTGPKTEKKPYGGYGPVTAHAGVDLVRYGYVTPGVWRSLKGRGFLGHRAPKGWRPRKSKHAGGGFNLGFGQAGQTIQDALKF